jgi:hypothetical protein
LFADVLTREPGSLPDRNPAVAQRNLLQNLPKKNAFLGLLRAAFHRLKTRKYRRPFLGTDDRLLNQERAAPNPGDGHVSERHPRESMKILDRPALCFVVQNPLSGVLKNLYRHHFIADHRELSPESRRKFIEYMLDPAR